MIAGELREKKPQVSLAERDGKSPNKANLSHWLSFIPFVVVFFIVCCIADIRFRIAKPFGMSALESAARWLNKYAVLTLRTFLGAKIDAPEKTYFPADRPYLIVCNHQSMFDIPIIHSYFHELRPRFIAKKELAYGLPGVSICLRTEGAAIIDRSDGKQAMEEIKRFAERANELSFAAVLFPEGTRSRKGAMKRFKPGGFSVLVRTLDNPLIIPCAIDGSWKFSAWRRGPMPYGNQVTFRVGEPTETNGKDIEELLTQCYEAVSGMVHDIRTGNPEFAA